MKNSKHSGIAKENQYTDYAVIEKLANGATIDNKLKIPRLIELKQEKLDVVLKLIRESDKEKIMIISNHIDGTFDINPGEKMFDILDSIGISILFASVAFKRPSSDIIKINIYDSSRKDATILNRQNKDTFEIVISDSEEHSLKKLEHSKKEEKFNEVCINDPLNTTALESTAKAYDLISHERELSSFSKAYEKKNKEYVYSSSKYQEVYNQISELEKLKPKQSFEVYRRKLLVMFDVFQIYFAERFAFGVINLGFYITSILANVGEKERAQEVYFKTEMYLNRNDYALFTSIFVQRCYDIMKIKAGSIFSLDEYVEITNSVGIEYDVDRFVYNVNLMAKYIEANNFSAAIACYCNIENVEVTKKNSEGVNYNEILLNNKLICDLDNSTDSNAINEIINNFERIANNHIIFALNYNLLKIVVGDNNYIDIHHLFSVKLDDKFYKNWLNLHDYLINYREMINNENEASSKLAVENENFKNLFADENDLLESFNKLVKSLEHETLQPKIDVVKTLLIDFNIWDYGYSILEGA